MAFRLCIFRKSEKIKTEDITPKPLPQTPQTTTKPQVEQPKTEIKREYQVKKSLMTNNELEYYRAIRATLPSNLILQPQVNLKSTSQRLLIKSVKANLQTNFLEILIFAFLILNSNRSFSLKLTTKHIAQKKAEWHAIIR